MKAKTIGLMLATVLLAGCWQKSVNPFYTAKDLVAEPKLGGTWTEQKNGDDADKMRWIFTAAENHRFDLVIHNDGEHHYDAHVFQLDGTRLLDVVLRDDTMSAIPAHHLFKLEEVGASLKVRPLNPSWVSKWLRRNPGALAHAMIVNPEHRDDRDKDELVLTADTKALQTFIRRNLADDDLFAGPTTFTR